MRKRVFTMIVDEPLIQELIEEIKNDPALISLYATDQGGYDVARYIVDLVRARQNPLDGIHRKELGG